MVIMIQAEFERYLPAMGYLSPFAIGGIVYFCYVAKKGFLRVSDNPIGPFKVLGPPGFVAIIALTVWFEFYSNPSPALEILRLPIGLFALLGIGGEYLRFKSYSARYAKAKIAKADAQILATGADPLEGLGKGERAMAALLAENNQRAGKKPGALPQVAKAAIAFLMICSSLWRHSVRDWGPWTVILASAALTGLLMGMGVLNKPKVEANPLKGE
jgi:hypothetical protein